MKTRQQGSVRTNMNLSRLIRCKTFATDWAYVGAAGLLHRCQGLPGAFAIGCCCSIATLLNRLRSGLRHTVLVVVIARASTLAGNDAAAQYRLERAVAAQHLPLCLTFQI